MGTDHLTPTPQISGFLNISGISAFPLAYSISGSEKEQMIRYSSLLIFVSILLIVGGCNELLYRLITSQSMSGLFFRFDVNYGLEMMGFHFNAILFGTVFGLTGFSYIFPVIRK